ncbi:hypothetical protein BX600DRAFT_496981 [Xylariales sp. PMI_506]|nr:hypothetical protein BX600DRAFT_496981 [Xylariales sp. PMI_506]
MASHAAMHAFLGDKSPGIKYTTESLDDLRNFESNRNIAMSSSYSGSKSQTTDLFYTRPQDALITAAPYLLELRQNNPQDCSNLIIASVDRATVEISRTIIALNATFSQQLQQASISASNGIRLAQNSASSMIDVVNRSAVVATSSAFSIATVARLAVTSANSAFTSVSSASSSDVERLSSSLSLIQASLDSAQASLQSTLASPAPAQPIPVFQPDVTSGISGTISLTPPQAAGIVIGVVLGSILLSLAAYFGISRMRRKYRDSYLSEKSSTRTRSPKTLPSRLSSTFRTGNSMVIRFNPSKSSDTPPLPNQSVVQPPLYSPAASSSTNASFSEKNMSIQFNSKEDTKLIQAFPPSEPPDWPLTSTFAKEMSSDLEKSPSITSSSPKPLARPPKSTSSKHTRTQLNTAPKSESIQWPLKPGLNPEPILDLQSPIENKLAPEFTLEELRVKTPVVEYFEPSGEGSTTEPREAPVVAPVEEVPTEMSEEVILEPVDYANNMQIEVLIDNPFDDPDPIEDPFKDPINQNLAPAIIEEPHILPIQEEHDIPTGESIEGSVGHPRDDAIIQLAEYNATDELLQERQPFEFDGMTDIDVLTRAISQEIDAIQGDELPWPNTYIETVELPTATEEQSLFEEILPPQQDAADQMSAEGIEPEELAVHQNRVPSPPPEMEQPTPPRSPLLSERDDLSPKKDVDDSMADGRLERELSPLRQNPVILAFPEEEHPVPLQLSSPEGERELSPLRRNPPEQSIAAVLAEDYPSIPDKPQLKEPEPGDREIRGRSMIRTSDIIEARLSAVVRLEKEKNALGMKTKSDKRRGSPPRHEAEPVMASMEQMDNQIPSPVLSNPSPVTPERKSPVPANSLLQPIAVASAMALSRYESPLRQNPPDLYVSGAPSSSNSRSKSRGPAGNAQFSQNLSKFQNLAARNPQDTIKAASEVTSRAIAGIYIPGSLREQAVRNVSRSRERGKSRARGT